MYLEIKSIILKVEHKICFVKQIVSYNSYRYEKFVSFSNFSDENNSISIPNRKIHVPKISPLPSRIVSWTINLTSAYQPFSLIISIIKLIEVFNAS